MKLTIQDVLSQYITIKADEDLYNKLKQFRLMWAQKSDEYVEFLGNTLTGVQPIRFSTLDEDIFYGILECDQNELQDEIYKADGIVKTFRIVSNSTHISLFYLMHLFCNSKYVNDKIRQEALKEIYYILAYKFLGSLMSHYFKYNLDPSLAKATYERLSNHFLLKKFNSWQQLLEYRANDVIKGGIHYKRIVEFSDVRTMNLVLSDLQGRLREIIKNIYAVLITVIDKNERIGTSSLLMETEDGDGLKDTISNQATYVAYMRDVCNRPNEFINKEILDLTMSMCANVRNSDLNKLVSYMAHGNDRELPDLVEKIIITCLTIASQKGFISDYKKHIVQIATILKGTISSRNETNKELQQLKKQVNAYVIRAVKKSRMKVISSLSVIFIMYIFLRAIFNNK